MKRTLSAKYHTGLEMEVRKRRRETNKQTNKQTITNLNKIYLKYISLSKYT